MNANEWHLFTGDSRTTTEVASTVQPARVVCDTATLTPLTCPGERKRHTTRERERFSLMATEGGHFLLWCPGTFTRSKNASPA
jgi:hypothetical protein